MDQASHQKTTRLSRFLPHRFDLPHPAQEIPLQTIYCVKILASESLAPAQEIILLQKNLCQDSCLRESRLAPSSRNSTAKELCQDSCLSSRN